MLHPASTFLRADPFAVMRRMSDEIDRAFAGPYETRGYPAVNIWQGADAAAITAELPGVAPEDIDLTVKDNLLTVSGIRKAPDLDDKAVWHQRERAFGKFSRTVQLPYRVDPDKIAARFENGVLQVVLPRPEEDKPRRITVQAA